MLKCEGSEKYHVMEKKTWTFENNSEIRIGIVILENWTWKNAWKLKKKKEIRKSRIDIDWERKWKQWSVYI